MCRCHQTPPRRSNWDPKPICHFEALLLRMVYVAWLFNSCIPLRVINANVKGIYSWWIFKDIAIMPFDKKLTCLTNYQERRSFPWSLVLNIFLNYVILKPTSLFTFLKSKMKSFCNALQLRGGRKKSGLLCWNQKYTANIRLTLPYPTIYQINGNFMRILQNCTKLR